MIISTSSSASFATKICFVTSEQAETILDFDGKNGTSTLRYNESGRLLYIGMGDEIISSDECRNSVASAIRQLVGQKITEISIEIPNESMTSAVVEGAVLGDYWYDQYLSEKSPHVDALELVGADESVVVLAKTTAESVCFARDLVNENAEIITPARLAEEAQKIADNCDLMSIEILTETEIREKGLGLLWAVGQGSATPPRLILIRYSGNPDSKDLTAIVGKGVTFDSGGLNMKPSGFIETMRSDMAGAAAVLATMKTLAILRPRINAIGVLTSAQNAVSNTAYFPGDVITGYDGTTVEVLNTDAEGRLILADAISYVKKQYEPTQIINMATLTGAVVMALGDTIAGLFSNNDELKSELFAVGESVGERLWELPIRKEHHEQLKSSIADLQNIGKKDRNASSITAAAFLNKFAGDTPWCHVDIAGVAWNKGEPSGINRKYATGYGVRLFTEYLLGREGK